MVDFSFYTQTSTCQSYIPTPREDGLEWMLGKTAESFFQPR